MQPTLFYPLKLYKILNSNLGPFVALAGIHFQGRTGCMGIYNVPICNLIYRYFINDPFFKHFIAAE